MSADMMTMLVVIMGGMLITMWHSQQKFKNKVLCIMHTQQGIRLELWVPLRARHIKYGSERHGDAGMYFLIPAFSCNTWWNKGINMLFPVMVKTWEFWWFHPYPQNPMTIQRYDEHKRCPTCQQLGCISPAISWHTPETRNAAWQEHNARAFARAQALQGGQLKQSTIERYLPLAALGLGLFALLLIWRAGLI